MRSSKNLRDLSIDFECLDFESNHELSQITCYVVLYIYFFQRPWTDYTTAMHHELHFHALMEEGSSPTPRNKKRIRLSSNN
jgi:hypothetical protein